MGRNSQTVREFLEKNYADDANTEATVRLAIRSLLEVRPARSRCGRAEPTQGSLINHTHTRACHGRFHGARSQVVQSGAKNIEVAVMEQGTPVRVRAAWRCRRRDLLALSEIDLGRPVSSGGLVAPVIR